ncbi:MAG TPA: LLM class flavin-dependent oxidoreductase [Candidatus Binatia bacterium]|nr:LLM class flavin-dependent oxidoreductase [Candidatus Binatia bacterium]
MSALRFAAAVTATSDFATIREACRAAEAGGFDAYTRPDHLLAEGTLGPPGAPLLECFTTLAALVPTTTRLRFLETVTCNSFRHPALLAKMVASLDVISGGRMELGIGAGWFRAEYEAFGHPFPPASVRLAQLGEALAVVKLLWTGARVDFDGEHYRLRGAICAPAPVQRPRPPILVGGGGRGLLAVAAAEADVVNIVPPAPGGAADPAAVRAFTLERFIAKGRRVRALAAGAGRDPATVALSAIFFVQLAETAREAAALLDALAARYGFDRAAAERFPLALVGTASQLRERLAERIERLGLGYVVLHFTTPAALARFAADVLPAVRGGART